MTLIAGVRCFDGFLVAADTAVTAGTTVFHGRKLDYYKGGSPVCRLAVASSGFLNFARMTSENIRDRVATETAVSVPKIKSIISEEVNAAYKTSTLRDSDPTDPTAPNFSLIVGIEVGGIFEIVSATKDTINEIQPYAFDGSGGDIAYHLAERLLFNSQNNRVIVPIAAAVHIVEAIFRFAKNADIHTGRNTEIIAWRAWESADQFFMPPNVPVWQLLWAIDENLKSALGWALEKSKIGVADPVFEMTADKLGQFLRTLRAEEKNYLGEAARVALFTDRPDGGWGGRPLDT